MVAMVISTYGATVTPHSPIEAMPWAPRCLCPSLCSQLLHTQGVFSKQNRDRALLGHGTARAESLRDLLTEGQAGSLGTAMVPLCSGHCVSLRSCASSSPIPFPFSLLTRCIQ